MEVFASYLLKSSAWITGFALIYFIFLKKERFFMLNRFYLLFGILASFLFPLIKISYDVEMQSISGFVLEEINETGIIETPEKSFDYLLIPAVIYLSGLFFFGLRTIRKTLILFKTIKKTGFDILGKAKLVRASIYPSSFTLFNFIFINRSVAGIEKTEILNHELVHISQKHWIDLVMAEILCLLMWANPVVWIYTRFIRLNHEYLADEVALQQTTDQAVYKAVLLNQIVGVPVFELSNSFNYSPGKNRFEMMKNVMTSPYRKLKVLYFLPVSVFLFYAFAVPEYTYKQSDDVFTVYKPSVIESKDVKGIVVTEDVKPQFSSEMRMLKKDPDYKQQVHVVRADTNPSSVMRIRRSDSTGLGFNGILVVDGLISTKQIHEIPASQIASITVLKEKSATDLYGDKAKNGVIIISTKNIRAFDLPARTINRDSASSSAVRFRSSDGSSFNGLYVVDGVIYEEGIPEISADDVESINILKDKFATDKYGDKGKNGVIEISTKNR